MGLYICMYVRGCMVPVVKMREEARMVCSSKNTFNEKQRKAYVLKGLVTFSHLELFFILYIEFS